MTGFQSRRRSHRGHHALAKDSEPNALLQVVMTGKLLNWLDWNKNAQNIIFTNPSAGVKEIGGQLLIKPPKIAGTFTKQQEKQLKSGQDIFSSLCFACHGFDGKGMPMPGREGVTLAPPLAGSKTVVGGDALLRVLLHGLAGPIEGKTYEAQMVTMGTNTDDWIADVSCYVRKSFGNNGAMVTKNDVKQLRAATTGRSTPWTIEELNAGLPQPLDNRKQWKLTASHKPEDVGLAIDGDPSTRWTSGKPQVPGMWFQIELPAETDIAGLQLDYAKSDNDYPRGYTVQFSRDGTTWDKPVFQGEGPHSSMELMLPRPAKTKFIRINQTSSAKGTYWSIHELQVLKPAVKTAPLK